MKVLCRATLIGYRLIPNQVEVEQTAFQPGNLPPGMGASPDKMLQARLLSYPDAHRYRIGVNCAVLPVNKPRCPVHHYHRDGNDGYRSRESARRMS